MQWMEIVFVAACFGIAFIVQAYFFYKITSSILSARIAADAADIKRVNQWITPKKKVNESILAKVKRHLGVEEEKDESEYNPDNLPAKSLTKSK